MNVLPMIKVNEKSFLDLALEMHDNPESLSEFTQTANVRPMALIEEDLLRMDDDVRNDILQAHLNMYSGWYLMASIHQIKVDGVRVRELLNPLSTNPSIRNSIRISTESRTDKNVGAGLTMDNLGFEETKGSDFNKYNALAVGKTLDVPLTLGGGPNEKGKSDVTVPVNVTLMPRTADIDFMVELFKHINKDQGWVERYHQYQAGEIKSLTDYIFALDIIREERKLALKDKDGIYAAGKARRAKGIFTSLLSGKRSINVASNIIIMTKRSSSRLEAVLDGGKLSSYKTRQRFFEETMSTILTVVNPERKVLTVYTRGMENEARWSFSDIKNMGSSPNAGFDMAQVMSSISRGSLPGSR